MSHFSSLLEELRACITSMSSTHHINDRAIEIRFRDVMPNLINAYGRNSNKGPDNLENLKKLAAQFRQGPGAGGDAAGGETLVQEDDDDVPELVPGETFEAAAEEEGKIATA